MQGPTVCQELDKAISHPYDNTARSGLPCLQRLGTLTYGVTYNTISLMEGRDSDNWGADCVLTAYKTEL